MARTSAGLSENSLNTSSLQKKNTGHDVKEAQVATASSQSVFYNSDRIKPSSGRGTSSRRLVANSYEVYVVLTNKSDFDIEGWARHQESVN